MLRDQYAGRLGCRNGGESQLGMGLTRLATRERNRNIRSRTSLGKRTWHTWSGYSKRSLAETTMCRYKTIIGPMVRARTLQGQRVEARVGCQILNRMTSLGMPESYRVD